MQFPGLWGSGEYEGAWTLHGRVPDHEEIRLGDQKVDLAELLRPPTYEERQDLRDYYKVREPYRGNCVGRGGRPFRFTTNDVESFLALVSEKRSRCSECPPITADDFCEVGARITGRWCIESKYDEWIKNSAPVDDVHWPESP